MSEFDCYCMFSVVARPIRSEFAEFAEFDLIEF